MTEKEQQSLLDAICIATSKHVKIARHPKLPYACEKHITGNEKMARVLISGIAKNLGVDRELIQTKLCIEDGHYFNLIKDFKDFLMLSPNSKQKQLTGVYVMNHKRIINSLRLLRGTF